MARESKKPHRPIYEIAKEIHNDWDNKYFGAVPYLEAMMSIVYIDEMYGMDTANSIVRYFLSNARTWKGETARRIKKELNSMI